MRLAAIIVLCSTGFSLFGQNSEQFTLNVLQGNETLDISKGLKSYEPLRLSWENKMSEKLQFFEVHFGNGQLPFTKKIFKIGKGQKLVVVNLDEFLALENRDLESPRKRESEFSRIVIVCSFEKSKYKSFAIPFKLQQ